MEIKQLLKVMEYAFKEYRNDTTNRRINLLEYYSLVDIAPLDLSKIYFKKEKQGLAVSVRAFDEKTYWAQKPVDMQSRLKHFHSIRGHELTPDDKLTIKEKLESEGYPLMEGIFDMAARIYVEKGVDAISKEEVSKGILDKYNKKYHKSVSISETINEQATVLTKKM